jgi:subtilase family serine protease
VPSADASGQRLTRRITVVGLGVAIVLAVAGADAGRAGAAGAGPSYRRPILLGLRQRGNPSRLASQVSDPGSRSHRRFLSLRQYQSRFAARPADRRGVLRYLAGQPGVLSVQLSSDQSVVLAVLTDEAGQRLFCARGGAPPTQGLCVPRGLRRWVTAISAGELYQTGGNTRDRGGRRSRSVTAGVAQACGGARNIRAFTPQQLSTAYGVDALRSRRLSGSGVRVDTLSSQEVGTSGFRTWARCFGLRTPVVRQFAMPGATLDTGTAPEETVLDVEALASLAPGLERITPIFVPLDLGFGNSFLLFMFGALDPSRQGGRLPDLLSISDGVCESRFTRDQLRLGERWLVQAAALGITALSSSGDLGFRGCFINKPGTMFPASSPFVTSVGGTDLKLTRRNRIASQVVFSTFATQPDQGVGSGGGASDIFARPSFQRAPGISSQLQRGRPMRLVPDVAAMASFSPGIVVYDQGGGGWGLGGGTSAAAPLTAAIVALTLQQERRAARPGLGSLPPLLYTLARGRRYRSIFFDITRGTSAQHPRTRIGRSPAGGAAQRGYDLATGLGSLKATAFAAAVATTHRPW